MQDYAYLCNLLICTRHEQEIIFQINAPYGEGIGNDPKRCVYA